MQPTWKTISLAALVACGAFVCLNAAEPAPARSAAGKPRVNLPTEREIRLVFQAHSQQLRQKLFEKLQRLGPQADRPEVVGPLVENLNGRISYSLDWQFVALLAGYRSDEATTALRDYLAAKDWHIVLAALRGLTLSERTDAWEPVPQIRSHAEYAKVYALRRAVVAYAEGNGSADAVDFLIQTVAEADGQLKYEAAVALTRLTGQEFGARGDEWRTWWASARDKFVAVAKADRPSISLSQKKIAWDGPVPEFYGIPIYARRVVFLLDRSRSMASSVGGEERIDRARKELEHSLRDMAPETEFNVFGYHDFVTQFTSQLVTATPETKREAILFAEGLSPELHTACYDALVAGLQADRNLEAIYFLSDGEPTAGKIVDPSAIVAAITQMNHLQMTSIYTLGIDARGIHEAFLKQLAAQNFGEFFLLR